MKIEYIELLLLFGRYYIAGSANFTRLHQTIISEILELTLTEYHTKMATEFNAVIQYNEVWFARQIDGQLALQWIVNKYNNLLVAKKLMGENITENDTLTFGDPNRFYVKSIYKF